MTIDKIRQQVKEWKEAREKAYKDFHYVEDNQIRVDLDPYSTGEDIADCTVRALECYDFQKETLPFYALAANDWDRIMANYLAMAEALEFYGSCAIKVWEPPGNNLGDRARETLEKVAGE